MSHTEPMHQLALLPHEITVDLFAGGGGASLGIERGLGRPVDVAVNHDPEAVAMHQVNHPRTEHHCESVFAVHCARVTRNQPVGLLWASPDCTHHSKAKGGKPVSSKRRGLAWVVVKWARRCRPRVIALENVQEFEDWGPLTPERKPCPVRRGATFQQWVRQLQRLGYAVEWRRLRACDYGDPTIRERLFVIARRDGAPIIWPDPTHGAPDSPDVRSGLLQPYRTAAECIDWSIPVPSIFGRKKPLADNTLRRIAKGVQRFVLDCPQPFIVSNLSNNAPQDIRAPVSTLLTGNHKYLCAPYFVPRYGERAGQQPRTRSVLEPLPTIVNTDNGAQLVAAFMEQANTGVVGHPMTAPVSTIVGKGSTQRLVHATLADSGGGRESNARHVAALLAPYYGSGSGLTGRDLRDPAPTVTSTDRLQLVTVVIDGTSYILTDIGMRMLQPRELYRAQGFPDTYVIDRRPDGSRLPKHSQVRMCGNSVPPGLAAAIVRANFAITQLPMEAAA
ncbi:DNA cytosine methyltransferase [Algiphilus sp.]|uniref:DNA cytosine methyltransferase n=1 Tax=Algiphilus sp. TaxID=1872431 RepID=UPI0025BC033F|nr:DNA cytosine methyltransferase [Algiphilus sp.]MCK5769503.1 DNA cytosine methyltransferase [Algiphilus sp.]